MNKKEEYLKIIEKFKDKFCQIPELKIEIDPETKTKTIQITIYFNASSEHGKTRLRVREKYTEKGEQVFYRYCWEIDRNPVNNIMAWENEPHTFPHQVGTDPHHLHIGNRKMKNIQPNYNVRSLENALNEITKHIP